MKEIHLQREVSIKKTRSSLSLYLSHSQHTKNFFFYGKVLICSRLGRDLSHGLFPKKACPSNKLNGKMYLVVRCSIGVCHVALDHLSRSECLTSNLATWKTSDIEALSVVSLTSRLIISRIFFSEILQTHRRKNPSDGLSAGCCQYFFTKIPKKKPYILTAD